MGWITESAEMLLDSELNGYKSKLDDYEKLKVKIVEKKSEITDIYDQFESMSILCNLTTDGVITKHIVDTIDSYNEEYSSIVTGIGEGLDDISDIITKIDSKIKYYEEKISSRETYLQNNQGDEWL